MTENPYLSIITLNINILNSPAKGHWFVECIKKQNPSFCCLQETNLTFKDKYYFKMKE